MSDRLRLAVLFVVFIVIPMATLVLLPVFTAVVRWRNRRSARAEYALWWQLQEAAEEAAELARWEIIRESWSGSPIGAHVALDLGFLEVVGDRTA